MSNQKQEYFLSLLEPVKDRLWRYVRSMLRHREDTEDVYGETILAAYERIDSLKQESSFLFFLFGIARRIVLQRRRKIKLFDQFLRMQNRPQSGHYVKTQTNQNPEANLDAEILYRTLEKLNIKEREAIVMFEISGFSLAEIQELQGDSLSAVKSRLARGRQKLVKLMQEHPSSVTKKPLNEYPEMLTV